MNRHLVLRLLVPLTALAAISLAAHSYADYDGFLINLSTELIGIALTVFYVDRVLREHSIAARKELNEFVNSRALSLIVSCVLVFRRAMGCDDEFYENLDPDSNPAQICQEAMSLAEDAEYDKEVKLRVHLEELATDRWSLLLRSLVRIESDLEAFSRRHGSELPPEIYTLLLKLEDPIVYARENLERATRHPEWGDSFAFLMSSSSATNLSSFFALLGVLHRRLVQVQRHAA